MNNRLAEIFIRQALYVESLRSIYLQNGFRNHGNPMPWPLDSREYQEEFRLLAWRLTEEICETVALASIYKPTERMKADYLEEIADCLHFLIELALATGVTRDELLTGLELMSFRNAREIDDLSTFFQMRRIRLEHLKRLHPPTWHNVTQALGDAMQHLRQRPWRTDHRPSERQHWVNGLHVVFKNFVDCCIQAGVTPESLYGAYFHKAVINDQRTASQPKIDTGNWEVADVARNGV